MTVKRNIKSSENHFSLIIFFFLTLGVPNLTQAQCGCDHIISLADTEWQFDGNEHNVQPGDKICFTSGTRTGIGFKNIQGTAEKPVIITNMCDGKVTLDAPAAWGNAIEVNNCKYIHFTGAANPNETYGIEIKGANMGINFQGLSSDIQADHLHINNVGCVGIVAKTDPTCDESTWRGNFVMQNLYFHHNLIENTGCEGFYIGNSHYNSGVEKTCDGNQITVYEHDMNNVEVAYNTLKNIGNDGIQVSAILENMSVHHNTVENFGIKNNAGHQNGLQSGAANHALIYNNKVDGGTGTGYGLFDTGRGNSRWYNNIVLNCHKGILIQDNPPYLTGGNTFANNLFYNINDRTVEMYSINVDPTQFINNIIITSTTPYFQFYNGSDVKFNAQNNVTTNNGDTLLFADINSKDFHLLSGSPLIDKATNLSGNSDNITFDYDEMARPGSSGKWDIGPYEFGGTVITSLDEKVQQAPFINPNPASNVLMLDLSGLEGNKKSSMQIVDQLGKIRLYDKNIVGNSRAVDVSTLTDGVYFFLLINNGTVHKEKFVIRK